MNENSNLSLTELINRWIRAFDEFELVAQYEAKVVQTKFSDNSRYDLREYANKKVKAGGKMLKERPEEPNNYYYEYGFDLSAMPVMVKEYYNASLQQIGFYRWEKNLIECIEFSSAAKVPSRICQLIFENGKLIKKQFFSLQSNGRFPIFLEKSKEEIIEFVLSDQNNVFVDIKEYKYAGDAIINANGYAMTPGIGDYTYVDMYKYANTKTLLEIKRFTEKWSPQIQYIKPSKKSLKNLVHELAAMFSDYLIYQLQQCEIDSPLFCLQINYHYCDNYWPHISIISENQKHEAIKNKTDFLFLFSDFLDSKKLEEGVPEKLEEYFAEFMQRITQTANWEAGRRFSQQIARLMAQNKLNGKVPVTNDFVAMAIDWTLTEDVGKILLKCGADKKKVKEWKNLRWF
jgi:hypothetical protein